MVPTAELEVIPVFLLGAFQQFHPLFFLKLIVCFLYSKSSQFYLWWGCLYLYSVFHPYCGILGTYRYYIVCMRPEGMV